MPNLHNDTWWKVSEFLTLRERSQMQRTCGTFRGVFRSPRAYIYNSNPYRAFIPSKVWSEWVLSKHFDGSEDTQNFSHLKHFRRLEHFCLRNNTIGCHTLQNCHRLKYLSLSRCNVTNMHCLAQLQQLTSLQLQGLHIGNRDLQVLEFLPNLQYLDISLNYNIDDISPVVHLKQLKHFNAQYSTSIYDLSCLSQCTKLETLCVSYTKVSNLNPLRRLKNLKNLYVNRCPITNVTLLNTLPNLSEIDLRDCPVNDITPLVNLSNVKITI